MTGSVPDVLILRGAPGVGKSSAAKALAAAFPGGAKVEVDVLRKMVISVNWTKQEEHTQLLAAAAGFVHDLAEFGFRPVIVVDTFSGDKVMRFLEILAARQRERTTEVFALHAAETALEQRLLTRPAHEFKDFEVSRQINADVVKFQMPRETLIDTSEVSPEVVARAIVQRLAERRPKQSVGDSHLRAQASSSA